MGQKILGFTEENGVLEITICQYFSEETGLELLSHLEKFLQRGTRFFLLDFSGCEVLNSPGVATLFDAAYKVKEEFRGTIVACQASNLVTEVIEAVNLSSVLPLYKTRSEALQNKG